MNFSMHYLWGLPALLKAMLTPSAFMVILWHCKIQTRACILSSCQLSISCLYFFCFCQRLLRFHLAYMHCDYTELLNTKRQNYFESSRTWFLQQTSPLFSFWILVRSVFSFSKTDGDVVSQKFVARATSELALSNDTGFEGPDIS